MVGLAPLLEVAKLDLTITIPLNLIPRSAMSAQTAFVCYGLRSDCR
jgi:hypothetical protein